MTDRKQALKLPFLFFILTLLISPIFAGSPSNVSAAPPIDYVQTIKEVNMTAISEHLKFFSFYSSAGFGSRMTGTIGCEKAADYIYDFFRSIGLKNVTRHNYPIVRAFDYGSTITVQGSNTSLRIFSMPPNDVAPVATPGLTAPVIYIRDGSFESMEGKNITGKVVILDYNTGRNWVNALKFGAKAVIFIEPDEYVENPITLNIPVSFPRFWMPKEDAAELLKMLDKGEVYVRIEAKTVWEERAAQNIYGVVEGENPKRFLLITAYYDSGSNVPSVSPGANEAVGISVLLELARFFTVHKPTVNLVFVAFSGHHQVLAGARWFLRGLLRDPPLTPQYPDSIRPNLPVFNDTQLNIPEYRNDQFIGGIHIQINSLSSRTVVTQWDSLSNNLPAADLSGAGTCPWSEGPVVFGKIEKYASNMISEIVKKIPDAGNYITNRISVMAGTQYGLAQDYDLLGGMTSLPSSEVGIFNWLGGGKSGQAPGLVFYTSRIHSSRYFTGTPKDRYETVDLKNIESQAKMIYCFMHALVMTENLKEDYLWPTPLGGPSWLVGRTAIYNKTTDTRDPLPGVLVKLNYDRGSFYAISDVNGFWDISLSGVWPAMGGAYPVTAYKINETDGHVYYASTEGIYKWGSTNINWWQNPDMGYIIMFPCASVHLIDYVFPPNLNIPSLLSFTAEVLEHGSSTAAIDWGLVLSYPSGELGRAMMQGAIFVPEGMSVDVILKTMVLGKLPLMVLTDIKATRGGQHVIYNLPLKVAEEFLSLIEGDMAQVNRYKLGGELTIDYNRLKELIADAHKNQSSFKYGATYSMGLEAWETALTLYAGVRSLVMDAASSVPFFALTLLPFTVLFTLLLFKTVGRKLLAILVAVFCTFLIVYSLLHPGFWLASNSLMVVLGVNVIILTTPIILLIYSMFMDFVKRQARIRKGVHYAEISRGSAFMMAINLGIENMKKRKLRSNLVMFTIILIVTSLSLFSSVSALTLFRLSVTPTVPTYSGILIRDDTWANLNPNLINYLQQAFPDAGILPRAWIYSFRSASDQFNLYAELTRDKSKNYQYYGALGVFPDEPWITGNVFIYGRNFLPTDSFACIIPDTLNKTGVNVGDAIFTLGNNCTVVGVFDTKILDNLFDLDGERLTPWDQRIPNQHDMHCFSTEVILFPYWTLYHLNPIIPSVSILPKNENATPDMAEHLFKAFPEIYMFYGFKGKTYFYNISTAYITVGWQMQIVPVILCGLIILNVMLASVKEREREISTYSAVGLSPIHVAAIFLAESIVFAVVGSIMGYVGAMSTYQILSSIVEMPIIINYSSTGVTVAVTFSMLMTLISTLYPSFKSSKLVTPSLERAWKVPTKPVKDQWNIPLPFIFTEEAEVEGLVLYLEEFISLHGGEMEVFQASPPSTTRKDDEKIISFKSKLAPYESKISQNTEIIFTQSERGWVINLLLNRTSGPISDWEKRNRGFIDQLRKQFLMWRGLHSSERQKYLEKAREITHKK